MTLRQYLILMSLGTVMCWIGWIYVLFIIDPTMTDTLGFVFFYCSLFLALFGTFSIIGFLIRTKIIKNEDAVFRHVRHTFRQGITLSSFVIILLLLSQCGYLTWWNMPILLILYILIEAIAFSNHKFSNRDYV